MDMPPPRNVDRVAGKDQPRCANFVFQFAIDEIGGLCHQGTALNTSLMVRAGVTVWRLRDCRNPDPSPESHKIPCVSIQRNPEGNM